MCHVFSLELGWCFTACQGPAPMWFPPRQHPPARMSHASIPTLTLHSSFCFCCWFCTCCCCETLRKWLLVFHQHVLTLHQTRSLWGQRLCGIYAFFTKKCNIIFEHSLWKMNERMDIWKGEMTKGMKRTAYQQSKWRMHLSRCVITFNSVLQTPTQRAKHSTY